MDSDFKPQKNKRPAEDSPAKTADTTEPETEPTAPQDVTDDAQETFKTPDEVAAEDSPADDTDTPEPDTGAEDASLALDPSQEETDMPKHSSRWKKWNAFNRLNWPPGKKEWIIIAVLVILLAIGGFLLFHKSKPATIKPIPKVTDASKTVPSTLTGLPVDPSVNQRTVTGVMIENSVPARPQSGLGDAGVVFEAIAEAGITRFLALYQDTAPSNVGPIRSARPYFIEWSLGFDAAYAHVGGSPEALNDIKKWNVRDLNQFYNGSSYHRVSSRTAPHNVYTSIAALNKLEVQKGFNTSHYTGFAHLKKAFRRKDQPVNAKNIGFAVSYSDYNVSYTYDPAGNRYLRSVGGKPQIDTDTNKQLAPVVVIAMVLPYHLESDGYHSSYGVIGSGAAYVFQNGTVTIGTWSKTSDTSQITFKDSKGQTIRLNPGQAWLTAVANAKQVTYSP